MGWGKNPFTKTEKEEEIKMIVILYIIIYNKWYTNNCSPLADHCPTSAQVEAIHPSNYSPFSSSSCALSYGMEYPFCQVRSAVQVLSPPSFLYPSVFLTVRTAREAEKLRRPLALHGTMKQQLKAWCGNNTVVFCCCFCLFACFLLKTKLITDAMKEKSVSVLAETKTMVPIINW